MIVLVRYHEIALKGRNRPFFIERLSDNLRRVVSDIPGSTVRSLAGRLAIETPDPASWDMVRDRLATVFGVANFGRAEVASTDIEALKPAVILGLRQRSFASFRVSTKRSNKGFPRTSMEVDRDLGGAIKAATGVRVDLEEPELTVHVEILKDRVYWSVEKLPGPGGLPVGSSGRVLALLSGGIDSPVAAARLMKRGCRVVLCHFHAFPLQDHTTIDKVRELARILTPYQFRSRLLLVPFGPIQQTIVASCPAPFRVVLYRRFMVRIAEVLAARHGAKALVTGESLGQVASQTLDNMAVVDEAAQGPILRPLVGMDKSEITAEAQRLGTFRVSTLPDQDCCQFFIPPHPATAARLAEVRQAEDALDISGLVSRAVHETEEERYEFPSQPDRGPS